MKILGHPSRKRSHLMSVFSTTRRCLMTNCRYKKQEHAVEPITGSGVLSGPALCAMYESTVTNPILTRPNPKHHMRSVIYVQWNLSIKGALNKGHLSNEDALCSSSHIELCTSLPLNYGHLSIQDSQLGPNGVHYREVPLYCIPSAGSDHASELACTFAPEGLLMVVVSSSLAFSTIFSANCRVEGWQRTNTGG